jgi:hypothetical protein
MFWRRSRVINGKTFPAAVRIRNVVIELGPTQYLPLFARQIIRTRFLSIWVDQVRTDVRP